MKLPFNAHTTKWDADNALALACASNIAYTLDQSAAAADAQSTFGFGNYHPFDTRDTEGFIAGNDEAIIVSKARPSASSTTLISSHAFPREAWVTPPKAS